MIVYVLLLLRFLRWRQVTVCLSRIKSLVVRWQRRRVAVVFCQGSDMLPVII